MWGGRLFGFWFSSVIKKRGGVGKVHGWGRGIEDGVGGGRPFFSLILVLILLHFLWF